MDEKLICLYIWLLKYHLAVIDVLEKEDDREIILGAQDADMQLRIILP
jgi:hypothetical protein